MVHHVSARVTVPLIALSLGLVALGCGETVAFSVLRAARVNVKAVAGDKEPTVAIGKWSAANAAWQSAANEIAQGIREIVTSAPGGVVKFAEAGGAVTLSGALNEHGYSETTRRERQQCSKYDEATKKYANVACVKYTRSGAARLRVSMNVLDGAGKTLAAETVPMSISKETEVTVNVGDGDTSTDPPQIDWDSTLAEMRRAAAAKLAEAVVPYPVVVAKPWFKCGPAENLCRVALGQIRSSDMVGARKTVDLALTQLTAAPAPDPKALAAAHWAMALACEFGGDYATAKEHVAKAITFDPAEEAFQQETASIAREQANAKKLSEQGVSE